MGKEGGEEMSGGAGERKNREIAREDAGGRQGGRNTEWVAEGGRERGDERGGSEMDAGISKQAETYFRSRLRSRVLQQWWRWAARVASARDDVLRRADRHGSRSFLALASDRAPWDDILERRGRVAVAVAFSQRTLLAKAFLALEHFAFDPPHQTPLPSAAAAVSRPGVATDSAIALAPVAPAQCGAVARMQGAMPGAIVPVAAWRQQGWSHGVHEGGGGRRGKGRAALDGFEPGPRAREERWTPWRPLDWYPRPRSLAPLGPDLADAISNAAPGARGAWPATGDDLEPHEAPTCTESSEGEESTAERFEAWLRKRRLFGVKMGLAEL